MKEIVRWTWLLPLVSGGIVLGCLVYCRFWWTPAPMGFGDPDTSIICWLFCKTLNPLWFYLGMVFCLFSFYGSIMMRFRRKKAGILTLIGGVLIIPAGFLNLISGGLFIISVKKG
jgi:hypothetical protein